MASGVKRTGATRVTKVISVIELPDRFETNASFRALKLAASVGAMIERWADKAQASARPRPSGWNLLRVDIFGRGCFTVNRLSCLDL
jgi:hypothetical protein